MPLLHDIEAAEWSDEAIDLFTSLTKHGPSDECGLIVLAAAAHLLATEAVNYAALRASLGEFGDLAATWFARSEHRAALRVVGGTDVC